MWVNSFVLQIISERFVNALVGRTLKHPADKVSLGDVETDDLQDNTSQSLQHDLEKERLSELSPGLVIVNDQSNFIFFCFPRVCNITLIRRARHVS